MPVARGAEPMRFRAMEKIMEMITAPSVTFSMTPFVWNTDAAVFVFKNGKANIDREAAVPGNPMKVALLGDEPNEAQVEAIKTIWRTLREQFGFAAAAFCPAIMPRMAEISAA
jgi:hypothetical protein